MDQRALKAAIAALALLVASLLWFTRRGSDAQAAEFEPAPPAAAAPAAPATQEPLDAPRLASSTAPSRTPTPPAAEEEPLEPGDTAIQESAYSDGKVRVEVRVMAPGEAERLSPHPYAGGVVHTQSWITETLATAPHEAPIDADGVARFEFDGPVHLDWFRADVPRPAGVAAPFIEVHEDIAAGDVYRVAIQAQPGGRVHGVVTSVGGRGLAGVEVSAYFQGDGMRDHELDDWYPGHFTALSGPGGAFEFAGLPEGSVAICVRPQDWLQIRPDLVGAYEDSIYVDVEVDGVHDVGELQIARRGLATVRVVDSSGAAVLGASVVLKPVRFDEPALLSIEEWEALTTEETLRARFGEGDEEAYEAFAEARRQESLKLPFWAYGDVEWTTDERGEAKCAVVEGLWEISATPRLGDEFSVARRVVRIPADDVELRLSTRIVDVRGRVLDHSTRAPVRSARVTVFSGSGRQAHSASTDASGEFLLRSMVLPDRYRLRCEHSFHFPFDSEFSLAELEPEVLVKPSTRLLLRVRDPRGVAIESGSLEIVSVKLAAQCAGDPEALAWRESLSHKPPELKLGRGGTAMLTHVWPGEYEVHLRVPCDSGREDEWGAPIAEPLLAASWSLVARNALHDVSVDLSSFRTVSPARYCTVQVMVLDASSGKAVEGAEVEVLVRDRSRRLKTARHGGLQVDVPFGQAQFRVRHPDYHDVELGPVVLRRSVTGQQFHLQPRSEHP